MDGIQQGIRIFQTTLEVLDLVSECFFGYDTDAVVDAI